MKKKQDKAPYHRPSMGVRMGHEMREALKEIAKEKCNTFNGIVELACKEFIERERGIRALASQR